MFFDEPNMARRTGDKRFLGGWKIFGIVISVILAIVLIIWFLFAVGACSAMNIVSWEVSREANNFNVVRELTVYNNVTGEIIMVAQGRISVVVDSGESQLEIMVANPGEQYEKHLVGLNETTTYIVRDLTEIKDVENFRYRTVINPRLMEEFEESASSHDANSDGASSEDASFHGASSHGGLDSSGGSDFNGSSDSGDESEELVVEEEPELVGENG